MQRNVIGVFQTSEEAEAARQELLGAGFPEGNVQLNRPQGGGERPGFLDQVKDFFGFRDTRDYEDAWKRGETLVIVSADDPEEAGRAADILQRHNPVDIDRHAMTDSPGTAARNPAETATPSGSPTVSQGIPNPAETPRETGEQRIPVVEEQLRVGKQREVRGGVRIYSRVREVPVEQDVTLRDERVEVERRQVDRPAGDESLKERVVEVTEIRETPVVQKEARVVEEVIVHRDVQERTEKVKDTVRRTEVDVQPTGGGATSAEDDLRRDYDTNFANRGLEFSDYRDASDYGRQLAQDQRYSNRDWTTIEPEVRQTYERQHPGLWDRLSEAVHRSYDRVRSHVRG